MIIGIDASRANEEQKTGVGWYAWNIIQELKSLTTLSPNHLTTEQPVKVVLYTNCPLMGELAKLPDGWTEKILRWPIGRLWTQVRLSWEMLVNPPDVLFIPAHVFPIIHPKKTIMTVHDIAAVRFPRSYNWFERWYTVWSAKFAVKRLWKVIVPSEFTKSELSSEFKVLGSELEKIKVIQHGYDERYKQIENKIKIGEILKKYKIARPYLLSIGRLEDKKNTVRIIKAFNDLRLKAYDSQLVLVGQPGYGYEKVKEIIEKSQFKNDIITPGWVSDEDLPYVMSGAEVFVFPSLYEGFGIPVLEAFASGVPVVASRGGALQEIGGEAVEYVNPESTDEIAQAIIKLLSSQELRKNKVDEGLKRIKGFGWEKCAGETLEHLIT